MYYQRTRARGTNIEKKIIIRVSSRAQSHAIAIARTHIGTVGGLWYHSDLKFQVRDSQMSYGNKCHLPK